MQMLGVRGMGLGAVLTFGLVLWWATRATESASEGSARLRETPASHAGAFPANARVAAAVKDDPAAAVLREEESTPELAFHEYVLGKYRFLLQAGGAQAVRAALFERERLVVRINTARQGTDETARAGLPGLEDQLADTDRRISRSLPAGDLAAFDALKDSHIEQFQLDDYAQGIRNVAPLDEQQRRAILYSKLAYRHRFREVLAHSGLMAGTLPPSQRQDALDQVARALRESRDGFLQEARQHLTDEQQYTLLANYENTEYSAELEKLRRMAAGG
jgi:hypothetical protein